MLICSHYSSVQSQATRPYPVSKHSSPPSALEALSRGSLKSARAHQGYCRSPQQPLTQKQHALCYLFACQNIGGIFTQNRPPCSPVQFRQCTTKTVVLQQKCTGLRRSICFYCQTWLHLGRVRLGRRYGWMSITHVTCYGSKKVVSVPCTSSVDGHGCFKRCFWIMSLGWGAGVGPGGRGALHSSYLEILRTVPPLAITRPRVLLQ